MTIPRNYDHKATGLDRTATAIVCAECGRLSPLSHCPKCDKHHDRLWWHKDLGQCSKKVDGLYYCPNDALKDKRGKPMLFCYDHSIEKRIADNEKIERKNQAPAFIAASGKLAAELGQPESLEPKIERYKHPPITEGVLERFYAPSDSRPGVLYAMARMVGGEVVHLDAECIGWNERGTCHHVVHN